MAKVGDIFNVRNFLRAAATAAAVAGATATGGPVVGAEVAAFLASPVGRRTTDAIIDELAQNRGVRVEDLANGGLVTMPTLGFTGEAGPEMVIPLGTGIKPMKRKRSRSARASDKKLSKAFKEANKRMRTKSGKLRKGKTQSDVARLAQRLRKKM